MLREVGGENDGQAMATAESRAGPDRTWNVLLMLKTY